MTSQHQATQATRREGGSAALRALVGGTAVTSLGDGMSTVGFPLLALTLTHSPLLISGVAFASKLPWLLVSLPGGALVDRVERRRLAVTVELLRALVLGGFAVAVLGGQASLAAIYLAAFVIGVGETLVSAAARGAIPLLVDPAGIAGANGRIFTAETAGERFAGPAAGGIVFAWMAALPFIGDAASYVASAVLLRRAIPPSPPAAPGHTSVMHDIRVGLRWFWSNRLLRIVAAVVTTFAFCQAMVLAVLVLYATRSLGLGTTGYGVFLAVAAVGDVAGGALAGRLHDRIGSYRTIVGAGLATGACYALLAGTTDALVAVVVLAVEAAASTSGNVATMSLRHRVIPTERFGLVSNAFRMCVVGVIPLGALAGGVLTTSLDIRTTFLVAGALQVALLLPLAVPLRRLGRSGATAASG